VLDLRVVAVVRRAEVVLADGDVRRAARLEAALRGGVGRAQQRARDREREDQQSRATSAEVSTARDGRHDGLRFRIGEGGNLIGAPFEEN
jgi:hypothetical protein